MTNGLPLALVTAVLITSWIGAAAAQNSPCGVDVVLVEQGADISCDSGNDTVDVAVSPENVLPVIAEVSEGWALDANVAGGYSLHGLPTGNPPGNGVIHLQTIGTAATPGSGGMGAGEISVTVGSEGGSAGTDTISATGVAGGASVPGGIWITSQGSDGYGGSKDGGWAIEEGGGVTVQGVTASDGGSITVMLNGSAEIAVTGTGVARSGPLGEPSFAGILAVTTGGHGVGVDADDATAGFGGDGGSTGPITITITTASGSIISVTETGGASGATGISAIAQGGALGTGNNYYAGTAGTPGAVTIVQSGTMTVSTTSGFGIYAASLGGQGFNGDETVLPGGTGEPADGGTVSVSLSNGGSIAMPEGGVGILALSHAGPWDIVQSTSASGGAVEISLDDTASITVGAAGSNAPFGFGVLAISAGSPLAKGVLAPQSTSGTGGGITIDNAGTIATTDDLAIGIASLSLGGAAIVANPTGGMTYVGNASNEVVAAAGGTLNVTHNGAITTTGDHAVGIIALSTGGGGIANNEAAASTDDGGSFTAGTVLGANTISGTSGTDGGTVGVTVSGAIATGDAVSGSGMGAFGVLAQSIGGSGGFAGGTEALVGIGDVAGGGGDGGSVTVDLDNGATVTTAAKNAHAIMVQSIGGGGGSGANSNGGFVAVGGTGGAGGNGGDASFDAAGSTLVETLGNYSHGILVQSIGGGGGNGGYADSAGVFVDVAVGGKGGVAGNGGSAWAQNDGGTIRTLGNHAFGMTVQSIGGGGGVGGAATSYSAGILFALSAASGATGGAGGDGDYATGYNHGAITTGIDPASFTNVTFEDESGEIYGTLASGETFTAYFASGAVADGTLSGQLTDLTLGDGTVIGDAAIVGTAITAAGFTGTVTAGGILQAVAKDTTGAIVGGILTATGFDPAVGGSNLNGANAAGMLVQSIGGGGGTGGSATAKTLVLPLPGAKRADLALPTFSFQAAYGGNGGAGGAGGGITAGNYAAITTFGDAAQGVVAQSIGGGGGTGGDATASAMTFQSAKTNIDLGLAFGGRGGTGGAGGTVTAFNGAEDGSELGTIFTAGQYSTGMLVQSIGGGGGAGATGSSSASVPTLHYKTGTSHVTNIAIGGNGGGGGNGGNVDVFNYAGSRILTAGSESAGIRAQSIGGGGGDGAGAAGDWGSDASAATGCPFSACISVGSSGGNAGNGGAVTVVNAGLIATAAGGSHGIHAQSIGGGGGNAGSIDTKSATPSAVDIVNGQVTNIMNALSKTLPWSGSLNISGDGGSGGDGGVVRVTNTGGTAGPAGIATHGERSFGILAQSIGGGGGTAGFAASSSRSAKDYLTPPTSTITVDAILTIGAKSSSPGVGGIVGVENDGLIATAGYGATGILAQSVSNGGFGAAALVDSDVTATLGVAIDRNEYTFGLDGGAVGVDHMAGATITTLGRDASAIIAQSVGGGGGFVSTGSDAFETVGNGAAGTATHTVTLGATGFEPSKAGDFSSNNGGEVEVEAVGGIATAGDWSHGIVAQSVGGGGGIAALYTTDSVAVEMSAGAGDNTGYGDGNNVTVALATGPASTAITTGTLTGGSDGYAVRTGYSAYGLLAQSIGGGGGLLMEDTASGTLASGVLSLGGGGQGDASSVSVTGNATITTYGDAAHAMVLQSIGMGGGIAGQGSSLSQTSPASTNALSLDLHGTSTAGITGSGGTVQYAGVLTATTAGADAFGLLAQSIGGGGGLLFGQNASTELNSFGGVSSTSADAGNVKLSLGTGSSITTIGDRAHAIIAQSIGGGGGIVGYASNANFQVRGSSTFSGSGLGGEVTIDVDGAISTAGEAAHGILAQSIGGGGGLVQSEGSYMVGGYGLVSGLSGTVTIDQDGSITTTGNGSSGIFAQSTAWGSIPADVDITVGGAVTGGSGYAFGVWIDEGNINRLTVESGGSLSAASGIAVNQTGDGLLFFDNAGTVTGSVYLGGSGGSAPTLALASMFAAPSAPSQGRFTNRGLYDVEGGATVDGDFIATTKSTLAFDFGVSTAPRLLVTGDATIDGFVRPDVGNYLLHHANTVVAVGGDLVVAGFDLPQTPIFHWSREGAGDTLSVQPESDFIGVAAGLDANSRRSASYLQGSWDGGDAAFSEVFATIYHAVDEPGDVTPLFNDLSPKASQVLATNLSDISPTILGAAMSCPVFASETALVTEDSCVWAEGGGDVTSRYDDETRVSRFTTGIGGQKEIADGWLLGGALGFAASNADGDGLSGDGTDYYASLAVKREIGAWTLGGALSGAIGNYSVDRRVATDDATLKSQSEAYLAGARLRVSYDFAFDDVYIRPATDFDLSYLHSPSYRESGASSFALSVRQSDDLNAVVRPSVEVGFRHDFNDAMVLRGYVGIGAAIALDGERTVDASLVGDTSGNTFATKIHTPDLAGALKAGVQVYQKDGFDVRAEYHLEAAEDFLTQGGQLRLSYRF